MTNVEFIYLSTTCLVTFMVHSRKQGWCQEFSDGGLTISTRGLKYCFQGTINTQNLRCNSFPPADGRLACSDGGYGPLALPLRHPWMETSFNSIEIFCSSPVNGKYRISGWCCYISGNFTLAIFSVFPLSGLCYRPYGLSSTLLTSTLMQGVTQRV